MMAIAPSTSSSDTTTTTTTDNSIRDYAIQNSEGSEGNLNLNVGESSITGGINVQVSDEGAIEESFDFARSASADASELGMAALASNVAAIDTASESTLASIDSAYGLGSQALGVASEAVAEAGETSKSAAQAVSDVADGAVNALRKIFPSQAGESINTQTVMLVGIVGLVAVVLLVKNK